MKKSFLLFIGLLLLSAAAFSFFGSKQLKKQNQYTPTPHALGEKESLILEDPKIAAKKYFIDEILGKYPDLQKSITTDSIHQVFNNTVFYDSTSNQRSDESNNKRSDESYWLVEVDNSKLPNGEYGFSHYLLTPTVEKILDVQMGCKSEFDAPSILPRSRSINNVQIHYGDKYADGVLILTSGIMPTSDCYWGAQNTGMISMFKISNGEKIPFSSARWAGSAMAGNINGELKGIYGSKKPVMVVEFSTESVTELAFFDLRTGSFIQKQVYR